MTQTRRLSRSTRETKIAGVCGGLAEYLDVDPVLVRLGAVAFTLVAPPAGVIAYVAGWIILPLDSEVAADQARAAEPSPSGSFTPQGPPEPPGPPGFQARPEPPGAPASAAPRETPRAAGGREGASVAGIVLVAVGVILLGMNLGLYDWGLFRYFRWRYFWPSLLILIGVWMIARAVGLAGRPEGGRR